jgi:2-haloacid dehalogenase
MSPTLPLVIAFDVNETLSDLSGLSRRFGEVGLAADLLPTWFAGTLRDGFALTAAGGYADFATVGRAALAALLAQTHSDRRAREAAADRVIDGIGQLSLHADVRPAFERLHAAGLRLVTLTNGSAEETRRLLERGGSAGYVEQCLSVEDVRRWKPAPEPYVMAAERCGVALAEVMLVAVHPWDIDGAKRAGLKAAWINRTGEPWPEHLAEPDLSCAGFGALAHALS